MRTKLTSSVSGVEQIKTTRIERVFCWSAAIVNLKIYATIRSR